MTHITRLLIAMALLAASVLAAWACEVEFSHFEDGSGRVTWCLPGELCKE